MLHDPIHITLPEIAESIKLSQNDVSVLQMLAEEWAKISSLHVHTEKARLWQKLNDLESIRPRVWINEIPWHEMNVNDELTIHCENNWARSQEDLIRKTIYQWKHMPGDMIINSLSSINSNEFLVYPNPTENVLNVSCPDDITEVKVSMIDAVGTRVFDARLSGSSHQIDVSHLPEGIYLITFQTSGELWTEKIYIGL